MWEKLLSVIVKIGFYVVLVAGLIALGYSIDKEIDWNWLVVIFAVARGLIEPFGFMWDIPTLYTIIGITLLLNIAVWVFRATLSVIRYFTKPT